MKTPTRSNGAATKKSAAASDTPSRILQAALVEFAEKGFDGARIEPIARRAGCNKSLVYRHFRDKRNLLQEVLAAVFRERRTRYAHSPSDPDCGLLPWFTELLLLPNYVRLMQREALDHDGGPLVLDAERRAFYRQWAEALGAEQAAGRLRADFDADCLLLGLTGLVAFPVTFPQLAELMTGQEVTSRAFRQRWERTLRQFVAALRPATNGAEPGD